MNCRRIFKTKKSIKPKQNDKKFSSKQIKNAFFLNVLRYYSYRNASFQVFNSQIKKDVIF